MTGAHDLAMKWLDAVGRLYEKLRPAISAILILLLLVCRKLTVFLWATEPSRYRRAFQFRGLLVEL